MAETNPRANRAQNMRRAAAPLLRLRYWLICLFLLFWVGLIFARLFTLQIVRHHEFEERAERQQEHTFEVAPRRGVLYDRNLHELATTVLSDSIYAVPSELKNKQAAVHALAAIVHTDPEDAYTSETQMMARVNASRGFAWVARRLPTAESARVRALNLKGVYVQKEFQRFYPDNQMAAQVLGYVGVDDNGLGGLEQRFNAGLHGQPGRMYAAMDARRRVLGSAVKAPDPGENLALTIDENIQYIAERALDAAMARTHADNGTIVIQDVHTGQILALAIRPTFNPNDFRHATSALLRDHAVSDVYEPGSIFKLVTYSAAMDMKVTTPDEIVDCQGGTMVLAGRVIHDDKSDHYGKIPVREALAHSSNIAAIKTALKLGQDNFYHYIREFGFGQRTHVELPGETRGLLRPVNKWGPSSIGSIAMGQEIAVTPVQLATMVSTIANGGIYLPPHIVMETQPGHTGDPESGLVAQPVRNGEELPESLPAGAHRVISTMAAAQMRSMMEGVILNGTGRPAQLNGYSAGGKTGTAQKIDPATHRYSKTMHFASFAGFAPVNEPVISVVIVFDDPRGAYYGTAVAAPVFAEVAQQVLEYLNIPHDEPTHAVHAPPIPARDVESEPEETGDASALMQAMQDLPADDPLREAASASAHLPSTADEARSTPVARLVNAGSQAAQKPAQTSAAAAESLAVLHTGSSVATPSFVGLSMRDAVVRAAQAGLVLHLDGRGIARAQEPTAGALLDTGSTVTVHFAP